MSYIGSASIVMRMKGLSNAKTIHSWIYNVKEVPLRDKYGKIIMDELLDVPIKRAKFIPVQNLDPNIKLIVIDEGYTVPYKMKYEIEKFGIKILVCGDSQQLPPIDDKPAYLTGSNVYHLNIIMRQTGLDDILYICEQVRLGNTLLPGYYGNSLVIEKQDLTDEMLLWADTVICGRNITRDYYNNRIRSLLGFSGNLPQYGEKIVCRKNNWLEGINFNNGSEINLVNGLIGRVSNYPDISGFDGKMFTLDFSPDLVNVKFHNCRVNYKHMIADSQVRNSIRNNRYEIGNMFEYAYCVTGWIAQGMQWHNVLYIEEFMHRDIQCSLNNVAASRADQRLIYVKK